MVSIIALNQYEEPLRHLDPSLCEIKETHEYQKLRSIEFNYTFQNLQEDKRLFQLGNKIWIQGDDNISDCLYIINTKVKENIFKDNTISFTAEEVLVELTNAPLFSTTDLSKDNFHMNSTNGIYEVYVDFNSLEYWFGDYFNIGVIQDCVNTEEGSRIFLSGTMTRMSILRQIEEETGNIFETRYEKDVLDNTIHRYLDFLNPVNVSKDWEFHINYKFLNLSTVNVIDKNGNPTSEDKPWDVPRYDTGVTAESVPESVYPTADVPDDQGTLIGSTYDPKDDKLDPTKNYTPQRNINPDNCVMRLTNTNGEVITTEDETPLEWETDDIHFTNNNQELIITIQKDGANIGIDCNNKSYAVAQATDVTKRYGYVSQIKNNGHITISDDLKYETILPDGSYFEIYDEVNEKVLFRTLINTEIGTVHIHPLDFGFNLENVTFDINETDTYTAVSPVISQEKKDSSKKINRTNFNDLLTRWVNLSITKGQQVPMIVQKIQQQAATLEAAKMALGDYTELSGANQSTNPANWWRRPYTPQDQTGTNASSNKWEFWRGTAYWKAPYSKKAGELFVRTDKYANTSYQNVIGRKDAREERSINNPKMGTTETSDEDIYAIYNQVCTYLRAHEQPVVEIDVDVANLEGNVFNDYHVNDKVYVKLPDSEDLVSARVTKTVKEANDMSKNTVTLSNYTEINSIKSIQNKTVIHAVNTSYTYPASKTITARLENLDYDEDNPYSIQYPANKLITFSLNTEQNSQTTPTGKMWKRRTDKNGYVKLPTKFKPGLYSFDISFGGDEEYAETTLSIYVSVNGKIPVKKTKKTTNKNKNTKKTVTKTTYWSKYGLSPDKKKILAIGRPSAGADSGGYEDWTKIEFKNKCPHCGQASLAWSIFYAGNEYENWGRFPATGNLEGGSAEGHIFCTNQNCDADYSCQGNEHVTGGGKKLTVVKRYKKGSKSEAYELKNGKLIYEKATTTVDKDAKNNKTRKVKASGISDRVKKQALAIVGDSTGIPAAKKVASWMDDHIDYDGYPNFQKSAERVLSSGCGNCCDQTRLFLEMCDVAGCTEYMTLKYRHVYGHVYALVIPHKSKNTITVDCASDYADAWGYICIDYRGASVIRETTYPNRPF